MIKVFAATLALSFCATTSFSGDSNSLITIRGLNVNSSVDEIENVLGQCLEDTEFEGSFLCYDEENLDFSSSYRIDQSGAISDIHLHCQVIKVCDYSEAELAQLLSDKFSLSEPKLIVPNEPLWGLKMDGPAGDRLFVMRTDNLIISISRHEHRE